MERRSAKVRSGGGGGIREPLSVCRAVVDVDVSIFAYVCRFTESKKSTEKSTKEK